MSSGDHRGNSAGDLPVGTLRYPPRQRAPPPGVNPSQSPLLPDASSMSFEPSSELWTSEPIGSSSPHAYESIAEVDDLTGKDVKALVSAADSKVDLVRAQVLTNSVLAGQIIGRLSVEMKGWCELVQMTPSKVGGYIQLSYGGANKFATLQEVVMAARGVTCSEGQQCSHRCVKPACRVPGHIVPESAAADNFRKGCVVHIVCPHHCGERILVCQHSPVCVKYAPGYRDMDDLIANGLCGVWDPSQDDDT